MSLWSWIKKKFVPPKSKSPWEAMTAGSTGGAFKWANNPAVKGAALLGAGMIPGVGPLLSGVLGASMGYPGSDKPLSQQLLGTAAGAIGGYGAGAVGSGLMTGAKGLLQGGMSAQPSNWAQFAGGFKKGVGSFTGTPIIPGLPSTSGSNIWGGIKSMGSKLFGMGGTQGIPGMTGGGGAIGQATQQGLTTGGIAGGTPGVTGAPGGGFNLGSIAQKILGAGLLGLSAGKPPSISTKPGVAQEQVQAPNLVEARGMIRDLAMQNPNELADSKQVNQFIDTTLKKTEEAYKQQRKIIENNLAAQGKAVSTSGGAQYVMSEFDTKYQASVNEFIADTRYSVFIAGIKRQIDAVTRYFNISEQEAADMLASYGYIDPQDLINYNAAMASYQGGQGVLGSIGSQLLASRA